MRFRPTVYQTIFLLSVEIRPRKKKTKQSKAKEHEGKTKQNVKNKKFEGASGIEPETSRSAVECSTTELCPQPAEERRQIIVL